MEDTPKISLYEQSREERIKENLQRMQNLGILDLSLKLKSQTRKAKRSFSNSDSGRKSTRESPLVPRSGPLRRSCRLQNATPVSYSEAAEAKKQRRLEEKVVEIEEGTKPEIYTEEHEKLLGNTERSWTFFVDGYGKDGKRIYDPVRGKTCHQCRQKTLGYRTQCSQCDMVQGQFCGDCLYMRYGEHVLEALENENWICPVCRGICNCSLCRTSKGWLPTGAIYRKISKLGYKSVAHYLIQTQRAQSSSEPNSGNQAFAKRSLSFQGTESLSEESSNVTDINLLEMPKLQDNDTKEDEKGLKSQNNDKKEENPISARRSLLFSHSHNEEVSAVDLVDQDQLELSETRYEDEGGNGLTDMTEKEMNLGDEENKNEYWIAWLSRKKKRRVSTELNPDSIGVRLRQRRRNHGT